MVGEAAMSRDMWRGYDAWRTSTPYDYDEEHFDICPAGEDGPELFSECGGLGECECYPDTWLGKLRRFMDRLVLGESVCIPTKDPECTCPSAQEIAEERAEARRDAMEDR